MALSGRGANRPVNQLEGFLVSLKDPLAAVQSLVTVIAIVIGGLWAYLKVFRGRTYKRRLEASISPRILSGPSYLCAALTVTIKNVGLARVDIDQSSSTITVTTYTRDDYEPQFHNAIWTDLGTISALEHHSWVEPGETVTEERLLALPNERLIAVGARLRLLPKLPPYALRRRRTEWNALAIAPIEGSESSGPAPKLVEASEAAEADL